jgi:hypothetical protein
MESNEFRRFAVNGARIELEKIYATFPELAKEQYERFIVKETLKHLGPKKTKEKKRHWTQTPEGRRKMRRIGLANWRKRKA